MLRILVVEDEESYVEALRVSLEREGFTVVAADDGRSGLMAFREHRPDVVLLDLMLPGLSGIDVLRRIREEAPTPVIITSAKDAEADVVTALELGADDYLTKPYSLRELLARIRAAVRRAHPADEADVLVAGPLVLDLGRHQIRVGDDAEDMPRKEFALLKILVEEQDHVVTRERLLDEVWGYGWAETSTKTLDQHIRRLRRRLETVEDGPAIETVRGVGYRLVV